jgi:hypothetical protein
MLQHGDTGAVSAAFDLHDRHSPADSLATVGRAIVDAPDDDNSRTIGAENAPR